MSVKTYVYTLNSRVIWLDAEIQHIPVIADMYRVHQAVMAGDVSIENCVNYVVKNFHKFEEELVLSPIAPEEMQQIQFIHSKVQIYMRLKYYINASYKMAFPTVFSDEKDQLEMLAKGLLDYSQLDAVSINKHEVFVNQLISDKKSQLKERFINFVHLIKSANSAEELQKVSYSIVFEGINIV
jgi:hypothetical protein